MNRDAASSDQLFDQEIAEIARRVAESVEDTWVYLKYKGAVIGTNPVAIESSLCVGERGQERSGRVPMGVGRLVSELRERMAPVSAGAWRSVQISLSRTAPGDVVDLACQFDYPSDEV